jgi:hypothetical protein
MRGRDIASRRRTSSVLCPSQPKYCRLFDEFAQRGRQTPVPVHRGVLVPERGLRAGVTTSVHEFRCTCSGYRCPCETGVPHIVKPQIGTPNRLSGELPDSVKGAGRDRPICLARKEPSGLFGSDEVVEMVDERLLELWRE